MSLIRFLFERRVPRFGRRIMAALIAPPVAMAVLALIITCLLSVFFAGPSLFALSTSRTRSFAGAVLAVSTVTLTTGLIAAYAAMVLIALPANILLARLGSETGMAYILIGGGRRSRPCPCSSRFRFGVSFETIAGRRIARRGDSGRAGRGLLVVDRLCSAISVCRATR